MSAARNACGGTVEPSGAQGPTSVYPPASAARRIACGEALVPGDAGYSVIEDRHPAAVFLKNLHLLLGHEVTARYLGEPDPGREYCLLCKAGR